MKELHGYILTLLFLVGTTFIATVSGESCGVGHMECNITKKCVPLSWKCDGDTDCGQDDTSDESDCGPKTCATDEWQCKNDSSCISQRWLCDGDPDCEDGSDESDCKASQLSCSDQEFHCNDGTCITKMWRCDGSKDCTDGDDESNCNNTCGAEMFTCASNNFCVSQDWVCDGDTDCLDGSDEKDCKDKKTCKSEEFLCADKSRCIDIEWYCDGDFDCGDHSDETKCNASGPGTVMCDSNEFTCSSGEECIHLSWKCDGSPDCTDGSDEGTFCNYTCRDDQFKCDSNYCIAKALRCDDSTDCIDGSDEHACVSKLTCAEQEMFDCHNDSSHCIVFDKVCDAKFDCPHREDEDASLCKQLNPCQHTVCGENSRCINTVSSSGDKQADCVCNSGFRWDDDSKKCKDVDECDTRGTCSQICHNMIGTYTCKCHTGYVLEKGFFCKAVGMTPWLYYANRHDIRRLSIDSRYMETVVHDTGNSIALDIDFSEGLLFWTDSASKKVMSGTITTEAIVAESVKQIFLYEGTSFSAEGLAVDWLHKNLYWTNTGDDTITVTNYEGNKAVTLISSDLDEPRSICVDPEEGYMYWTDWGRKPYIGKAGMDGSDQKIIIDESALQWPNGISIDYVGKRLYWIDAKLKQIGSAKLDGSDIFKVLHDPHEIQKPYGISVFEDSVYYTDWDANSIRSVNKINGRHAQTLSLGSLSVMDIKIYHEKKQNLTLAKAALQLCADCHGICVPKPLIGTTREVQCLCDGVTCPTPATRPPVTTAAPAPETTRAPVVTETTSSSVNATESGSQAQGDGTIAIIAIVVASVVFVVFMAVIVVIYKRLQARNKKSMNFDNPVYRKTTTTDDTCMIPHDDDLARHMEPLTAHHETA